ncbi:DUF4386 family protein [Agromyces mariniharenae]|uniref:DUF4386 domain-containing protein n=1 Tax=Agromyces mariniharenae TaxID=2604423 RepID=A0A5S4UX33_9MICO|nr:DUF4386 family protein [Agromyces mariniharenae]TYL51136.1 DUF4386 domain-containing protein [Agromyces mariniharenae]
MIALAVLLIATPLLFNAGYAGLAVRFDYPGILRRPTGEILERFRAGGTGLVLLWFAFAWSALLFIPVAVLAGGLIADPGLAALSVAVGVIAGTVQALGLLRWVFVVPFLAREHAAATDASAIDLVFQVQHRYLGVAVGEHLGYLTTGAWTILVAAAVGLPLWLAIPGIVIGAMLALGSLEFVGPFEQRGWSVAGVLVPIGYTLWSLWLIALGVLLLVR